MKRKTTFGGADKHIAQKYNITWYFSLWRKKRKKSDSADG
jgi:hypothetical protein